MLFRIVGYYGKADDTQATASLHVLSAPPSARAFMKQPAPSTGRSMQVTPFELFIEIRA